MILHSVFSPKRKKPDFCSLLILGLSELGYILAQELEAAANNKFAHPRHG